MTAPDNGPSVPRVRIAPGYSIHLGGPWYIAASPDTGRVSYTKDHGTGTHTVPPSAVPPEVRAKAERYAR